MGNESNRYKQMERFMTIVLCADTLAFILYLIFADLGIIWLKVTLTIICFILSFFLLWILYATKELLRQRSLWMSIGAASIAICLLFSLLLNYPSPNKHKQSKSAACQITEQA